MAVTAQLSYRGSTANAADAAARLKGHSGATLQFIVGDSQEIVRKIAADRAQNDRLIRQAELQRRLVASGVSMPPVLAQGKSSCGKAYFDMEYVPADNIATVLRRSNEAFDHNLIASALTNFLAFCVQTRGPQLPPGLFAEKIALTTDICLTRRCYSEYSPKIFAIARRLLALSWAGIPESESHGDLTLENILLSRTTGVVFVDCDVAFASSYWLDVGKLFQDIEGLWCLRDFEGSSERQIATDRLQSLVRPVSNTIGGFDRQLIGRIPQLASLNLFRTLPYVKSARTACYVLDRIEYLLGTKVA